jgi:hypothetical protein
MRRGGFGRSDCVLGVAYVVGVSRKHGRRRPRARRAGSIRTETVVDPWPSDWIEWGGVEMFVIGHTAGGAPYGLTRDEYERNWEDDEDGDE